MIIKNFEEKHVLSNYYTTLGIYRKQVQHKGAVNGDLYMIDEYGHPDVPYARIIIRRKNNEQNEF